MPTDDKSNPLTQLITGAVDALSPTSRSTRKSGARRGSTGGKGEQFPYPSRPHCDMLEQIAAVRR